MATGFDELVEMAEQLSLGMRNMESDAEIYQAHYEAACEVIYDMHVELVAVCLCDHCSAHRRMR